MRLKESDINRIVDKVVNEGFFSDLGNTMKTGWNKLTGKKGLKGTFSKVVQIDCIKKTLDGVPGGPVMAKFCGGGGAKPTGGGGMMSKAAEMAKKAAMANKVGGSGTKPTTTGSTGGGGISGMAKTAANTVKTSGMPTTSGTMNEIWRRVRH